MASRSGQLGNDPEQAPHFDPGYDSVKRAVDRREHALMPEIGTRRFVEIASNIDLRRSLRTLEVARHGGGGAEEGRSQP